MRAIKKSLDLNRHPCFHGCAKGLYGRIHLPVAFDCNIQCNYCNRAFNCVNESRPGVTAHMITPEEAVSYIANGLKKEPRITVAGIAGPGDPFCDPEQTLKTLCRIKKAYPDLILCLSSNGLNVSDYVEHIVKIGVSHITITINAVDSSIGAKIYKWIRLRDMVFYGEEAAEKLLENQLKAVKRLKASGIMVKINTVVIPTINEHHITTIAKYLSSMGVDIMNCIPMLPVSKTKFEGLGSPELSKIASIRKKAGFFLSQMKHCRRCRADASGML